MEKPDNPASFIELPISSNKKDNDSIKQSHGFVNRQLYVGHVKGLQKAFENISSKEDVIYPKATAKPQQYGSLREKKHKVLQDEPVTPGVHGPVYSKVYNPLRKDHLEKRSAHIEETVTDSSEKSNTVPTIPQSNMDSDRKSLESKGNAQKYTENVELTSRYHSDNLANYRKARIQPPDLKIPPRTPTPPPYKTKNNVSISLNSPRGWRNQSVRTPISSVAQQFANQRNNSSPMPSQTSGNFFFSGGNESHSKLCLEIQQNLRKDEQDLIQPKYITKGRNTNKSQESNKEEVKPLSQANILHDVSHIVDEIETSHSSSFDSFGNPISNETQEDSIANENLGLGEMHERFTEKHAGERMLIEDAYYQGTLDILKSRGKEVCIEETMTTSKSASEVSHDIPPVITHRRKSPDYLDDAYINRKLENTLKEKVENANERNKLMDINHTTVDSMAMSNENRNDIVQDLRTNKTVKSKYRPTIILHKSVNKVNRNAVLLTKRINNDEMSYYKAKASVSDQPLKEETKTQQKHTAEKPNGNAEFLQCEYKINNSLRPDTLYEDQYTTTVNQAHSLTDQCEGEKVLIVLGKGQHTGDLETDIEESTKNMSGSADGDSTFALLIKGAISSYIEQTEMDIPDDNNGFAPNKIVDKKEEDKTPDGSTIGYSNHEVSKDKGLTNQQQRMVSITIDGQMDYLNDIDERSRDAIDILVKHVHEAQLSPHPVNRSSLAEDRSKYEQNINSGDLLSTDTFGQILHMDSNQNDIGRDIMDHGHNFPLSVESEDEETENVSDICKNSTAVKMPVSVIQEKTDEGGIYTLDTKYQGTLDVAVAKDDLFASALTVNAEVEQSKDQAAPELIVLSDSSVEKSEQPCNDVTEDPYNMLNTAVNTTHLSHTHVQYENRAPTGDVDHNVQHTDLMSEHPENGAQHALDVINQFVNNKAIEKRGMVCEDDLSIFTDKDIIGKQPVNEALDQTEGEVGPEEAEHNGSIFSAKEDRKMDNDNSIVEHKVNNPMGGASQGSLRYPSDPQNIPDTLLVANSGLKGEEKENDSLYKISQHVFGKEVVEEALENVLMDQVEKVSLPQNDKCLIEESEDAVYDKEEVALDPDEKKANIVLVINDKIQEHARVKIPNDILVCTDIKNSTDKEETESSENMEMWVNNLRRLESPEFMKHLKEPRQARCSSLSTYGTLPPIKEDQGSPKSDHSDFRLPFPEIKEKKIPSEQGESIVEPKVAEQAEKSEQDEKRYSWERKTERSISSSSPLELMRKHSGDEVSRSDGYRAFIAQTLSQRQSSIIGSLLLSERLDKKTDTSEGKSYSRLESSFLLGSYRKPQKDQLEVAEGIETISANASASDSVIVRTNNTPTNTTEYPEDNIDSSISKLDHVAGVDSAELPSKQDTPIYSPFKVFPDVWHHPEKSHGKLNPRPGKIILFSEPGFKGHSYEIYSDVCNTCDWELLGTISVKIIRGGWLLYEKPHFRGRRVMLSEGDTNLTCPWEAQDNSTKNVQGNTNKNKSWIGSLRHVVRDFQVPQISLFMDENGEGNKVTILGATPDSRVSGQPIKTESIIVHSGLWLLYSKPFFEGDPYILESGGYPNRKAWNGHDSHLCSLQPARIGGPTVEKPNEPKIHLFQHPEFKGHCWEVYRDLHSLQGEPNQQGERLTSVGSLKVFGGCWVAYEKEGFHGHQYLLEEGEYQKCSQWGGCTEELGALRHIRTGFSEPEIILYEKPGCLEGSCLRLNEALADIEVAQYGTNTGSIQVLNGVWVAYENVDFSGEQYVLEKGIYHSYHNWGAKDSQICSVQPVLQVGGHSLQYLPKIQMFSEPNFRGDCMTHTEDHILLSFSPQSCRIEGGSWILYEGEDCCGEQYLLVEGDYPTRTAMGCQAISILRSLKKVPLYFSIPSISLHGLERFEGKELEFTGAVRSLQGEGYNNHVLSIKVASGIWVLYEHSDFRGRQWLLGQTQITNWLLFSGIQRIGSLCPIRQRRVYFRLRNRALGLFLCVPELAENMKAARVQVTDPKEGSCDLWYFEEGCIKNQMTPQMSLQVVGMTTPGTKVVMWSEGRKPIQTWSIEDSGLIMSCLFEGLCLDVKGGHSYDSDHVVVWETAEDRLTQHWYLEVF